MFSIKITVPGEPVPKGRHRARIVQPKSKPAFIHFYQDADTEAYEKAVGWQAKFVMKGRGLLTGALRIEVVAYLKVPASWSAKQKERALVGDLINGLLLPISRPDGDNFLKAALDAMNGIVYKDDSQVTDMSVKKRYSDNPRLEIVIFPA